MAKPTDRARGLAADNPFSVRSGHRVLAVVGELEHPGQHLVGRALLAPGLGRDDVQHVQVRVVRVEFVRSTHSRRPTVWRIRVVA